MKKTPRVRLPAIILALICLTAAPVSAQVSVPLRYSIAPPFGTPQTGAMLGSHVAVDGGFTVVTVPTDDLYSLNAGTVKIIDSATGALLFVLVNPMPQGSILFGSSVAISGTRVAVGAPQDNIQVSAAGRVYIYDLSSATPTLPVSTLNNPSPAAYDGFGNAVAISGTRVVVGNRGDDTGATDAGNAYVYDLGSAAPTVPLATLNNPSPAAGDAFGCAVGISGTLIVVGAFADDTGATDAGSAYVYDLNSATPTVPMATLNEPNPVKNDNFGSAVTISGTRLIIGAPGDSTGASAAGSAYFYDLNSGNPTVPATVWHNPVPGANDRFGSSVGMDGASVVVGAPNDDTGATDTGSTYIYNLTAVNPALPVTVLNNPDPGQSARFGYSVAISGTRAVVGAPGDSTAATQAGAAYGFDLSSATPALPVFRFRDPAPSSQDEFGYSVAISGNYLVAGAPYDVTGGANAGSAYVYDLSSATPTVPIVTLHNPNPANVGNFGTSVAISGPYVVVGAPNDSTTATSSGSACVYDLSSSTPSIPWATLNNPTPGGYENFGYSVAVSGTRIVIGASGNGPTHDSPGIAYIYDLTSATPTLPVVTLNKPAPISTHDSFGFSVAISGSHVVVGAYRDSTKAPTGGSAYVYDLDGDTPTVPTLALFSPNPSPDEWFGYTVAISGTRVVVGVWEDSFGRAFVYDLSGATPTVPAYIFSDPSPALHNLFGRAVAISGTQVIVGDAFEDMGATNAGAGYVYDLNNATPTTPVAALSNPNPVANSQFGLAMAIDGTTIVFGMPLASLPQAAKGYVYVFGPNPKDQDNNGLLDSWEIAHLGSSTGHSSSDDDEHDGLSNLLEEAFGSEPLVPDGAAAPMVMNEGGYLTITITKHPGVTYLVQSAGTPASATYSAATTTVLLDNATTLKVRDNALIGTTPGRFMRVQVTAVP